MTVNLNLSAETERRLRDKAAQIGLALEASLQQVIERDALSTEAGAANYPGQQMSQDEWERLLDALSDGLPPLPTLPADWSRADIYDDHD